jgi:hypothetical protein
MAAHAFYLKIFIFFDGYGCLIRGKNLPLASWDRLTRISFSYSLFKSNLFCTLLEANAFG